MHELSLAENIVGLLEAQAVSGGFTRVRSVRVEVGALSAVEPDALAFAFDEATRGTLAEGAVLDLVRVEGRGRCPACGTEQVLEAVFDACLGCGRAPLNVIGGDRMRVLDAEVE